jgi:hypothetical protein
MKIYQEYKENKHCKIFKTTDFAFRQITIERPLRLKFDITKEKLEELKQGLFLETEGGSRATGVFETTDRRVKRLWPCHSQQNRTLKIISQE